MEYPDFTGASCRNLDTNLFYIDDANNNRDQRDLVLLKKMCATCPLVSACAEWSLHHELYGFWAGTTERDRKFLRAKLNIEYTPPEWHPHVAKKKGM